MVDIIAMSGEVLKRLSNLNYELGICNSNERLIFPKKKQARGEVNRISEQELRLLFIEEFLKQPHGLFYSIETPTIEKYRFKKAGENNDLLVKQSALYDMCIFEFDGTGYKRILNIEFKHKAAFKSVDKDVLKLVCEKQDGAFILLLENTDRRTLRSVVNKFLLSFATHKNNWKGQQKKIEIIILSLERKNKSPFFRSCTITEEKLNGVSLVEELEKILIVCKVI